MDTCTEDEIASLASPVAPSAADHIKHEVNPGSFWATSSKSCLMDGSDPPKCPTSGCSDTNNTGSPKSDLSYNDDNIGDVDDDYEYADDFSDYIDDYMAEDEYAAYQSQFDNVDLPSGVEAPVPWLMEATSLTTAVSFSTNTTVLDSLEKASDLGLVETTEKVDTSHFSENLTFGGASSSAVLAQPNHEIDKEIVAKDVAEIFKNFKLFDVVEDISDHHFSRMESGQQPPKTWAKKIQEEWNILEKNLPGTIFVRVCETRMELLRAVIIGPSGTPYHDGLFVFDCVFPPTYPEVPPMVYYYSGGLRLNPNLYACGKVCLSLLGTWSGREKNENWIPSNSTMLQVLVSIQALILNAEPFYNEPGYAESYKGATGKKMSLKYSEDAFVMSLKTMMYTMRRPPEHFEDLVLGHFRDRASDILVACRAYAEGAKVGSFAVQDGVALLNGVEKTASSEFRATVKKMINILIKNFTQFGSIECEQFRVTE